MGKTKCRYCLSKLRSGLKNFSCNKCNSTYHDMGITLSMDDYGL